MLVPFEGDSARLVYQPVIRLFAAVAMLSACVNEPITVRDAAEDLYTAECQRFVDCGGDVGSVSACVEAYLLDVCARTDCDAIYKHAEQLESCVARYERSDCSVYTTICDVDQPQECVDRFNEIAVCS